MMQTEQPGTWESDDSKRLKDFLSSTTGERALAAVLFELPRFVNGPNPHDTLVAACVREGYQRAIQALVNLTVFQPEQPDNPPSVNYPELDREDLWKSVEPPVEKQ
jgi:hypothetical protein